MNLDFDTLFTLQFKHDYFADGILKKLTADIDLNTRVKLNNYGLLFKSYSEGFKILYDKNFAGQKRTREDVLDNLSVLRFNIILNDQDFFNYTNAFSKELSTHIFYFHNLTEVEPIPLSEDVLHEKEHAGDNNLISLEKFPDISFNKPFGLVDIRLNTNLPQTLTIRFSEKKTFWRYVIAGDHLLDLNNPAIIGDDNTFVGPEKITLPDSRKALTFESSSPIPLKQFYNQLFKLVENYSGGDSKYKVVLKALPVPDIKVISSIPFQNGNKQQNYSEIFIN